MALALAEERCRHEALLAAEADVQRRHEAVLAAEADVQRRHEKVLAAEADVQRRHKEMLAAVAADVQRRHESAAGDTESDAAIERIRTEFALCAAPLDAILAEIACEEAAIMKTLSPGRPTSYVDAVLSNMGGGTQSSLPLAGSPALPSPDVASRLQTVRPRARPRRRTGRRHVPRAPSSSISVVPTHPCQLQGGLPMPPSNTLAGATSPSCSVCPLLRLDGRHLLLPPSNPLLSMKESFLLPGEGLHSVREDFVFLHGRERDASTAQIVLAGVINLALPIALLDGLRWEGGVYYFLVHPLEDQFPFFPWYLSVDCWIQFFQILCLVVSLGLFVHLPLFFRFHFGSAT